MSAPSLAELLDAPPEYVTVAHGLDGVDLTLDPYHPRADRRAYVIAALLLLPFAVAVIAAMFSGGPLSQWTADGARPLDAFNAWILLSFVLGLVYPLGGVVETILLRLLRDRERELRIGPTKLELRDRGHLVWSVAWGAIASVETTTDLLGRRWLSLRTVDDAEHRVRVDDPDGARAEWLVSAVERRRAALPQTDDREPEALRRLRQAGREGVRQDA